MLKGAAGLVIGFHLPGAARAQQSGAAQAFRPMPQIGRVRAQRLRPHRHGRHGDGADQAHRVRPGAIHRAFHDRRRGDWTRTGRRCAPSTRRRIPISTTISPFGVQGTGGSTAIANSYEQMRKAGATARAMLVQAAARPGTLPAGEITVERGVLRHAASGRKGRFGAVRRSRRAPAGAGRRAAEGPVRVPPDRPRGRGQEARQRRDKSNGTAQFTIDIREPGMLTVVVARPPRFGGKVASFDATRGARASRAWST